MNLIILGAGGFGKVVEGVASSLNKYKNIYFLDDNSHLDNVIGKLDEYQKFSDNNTEFFVAFGNNEVRFNWI